MAGMHAESLPDTELWDRAVASFRARDWWLAHEWFEELWKRHRNDDAAALHQGLLQAAVCLHHFGNGNFAGARQMAKRALPLLASLPGTSRELNIAAFRDAFALCTAPLLQSDSPLRPLSPASIPLL